MLTITQESTLTKKQVRTYGPKEMRPNGAHITATVRFDDQCGNGHNTFSITGSTTDGQGGCIHDLVAVHFPELAPFIKWHLTNTDGPMHYVANTVYHADEHGPKMAWVYFDDPENGIKKKCMKYCAIDEALEICLNKWFNYVSGIGYRYEPDTKTAKVRNLDHARHSAVWTDATDEELTAPGLKERLEARLPALMAEFRQAVESLGFTW